MTKYQEKLKELAERINKCDFLIYEVSIARRNGNYCVEKYEGITYQGTMFIGDYKETLNFLRGVQYGFFYTKLF